MTEDEKISRSVENFLKAVYVLQQQAGGQQDEVTNDDESHRVSTNALAETLGISAPSVTDMARRMVDANLIDHQKYYGVRLTPEGEAIALRVIRRHRLIELYLAEELGYNLHEVHDEAEELEHAVSDRFIEAIATKLDDPTVDPHGDPIPSVDGIITRPDTIPLSELPLNTKAQVSRFTAVSGEMLQHILARGFKLGSIVSIIEQDPFEGPLTVAVGESRSIIGHNVAACILVEVVEE